MRTLKTQKCRMVMLWAGLLLIGAVTWGSIGLTVRAEGSVVDSIKDGGAKLWQKAQEKAPEIKEKVTEKIPEVKEKAKEVYNDASDAISNYREQSEEEFWDWFDGQTNDNGPRRETEAEAENRDNPAVEVGAEADTEAVAEVDSEVEFETETEVADTEIAETEVHSGADATDQKWEIVGELNPEIWATDESTGETEAEIGSTSESTMESETMAETESEAEANGKDSEIRVSRFERAASLVGVGVTFWAVMLILTMFLVTPVDASPHDDQQIDDETSTNH